MNKFTIVVDTREQLPYKFSNSVQKYLKYGDYTVEYDGKIYEDQIIIERKSNVSELFSATGSQRERWERELVELSKIEVKLVLCEFSFLDIVNKQPPGVLEASSVYGSIASWQIRFGIPFLFCDSRQNARAYLWKLFDEFTKHKIVGIK